jgi:N-acetylmuramoyl-L-alanine amidase/LysM repeat protein
LALALFFPALGAGAQPAAAAAPFRVVLDPGHGGQDPGAISKITGVQEKDVTLRLALLAGAALQRRGVAVVYSRTTDSTVSLQDRAALPARSGANALISLHLNAASDPAADGVEAWYGATPGSADLAGAALAGLAPALRDNGVALRGTRSGPGLVVLKGGVPAALVEVAYLSNPREAPLLTQGAFLQRVAEGLADGVVRFRDGPAAAASPAGGGALPLSDLYFVRPGDTLGAIAARFKMAVGDLLHLNPAAGEQLLPGDPLHVPTDGAMVAAWSGTPAPSASGGSAPPSRAAPAAATYTVAPGDTLSGIALATGVGQAELARLNGLPDANQVRAGQTLRLTAGATPSGGKPAPTGAGGSSAASGAGPANGANTANGASRRYRVQPGDTLSEIAQRNGVSLAALRRANPGADGQRPLLAGTTLTIPAPVHVIVGP